MCTTKNTVSLSKIKNKQMTTTTAIDPIQLDEELDIETIDVIEEAPKPDGIDDEDAEEEVEFFKDEEEDADDSDDDDDEDAPAKKPKVKKEPKVKMPKKSKKDDDEPQIKRVPLIGQSYKAKYFAIEIIGKGKTAEFPDGCYFCKVTWATEPCRMSVGDTFEAGEIAFYSQYYSFVS